MKFWWPSFILPSERLETSHGRFGCLFRCPSETPFCWAYPLLYQKYATIYTTIVAILSFNQKKTGVTHTTCRQSLTRHRPVTLWITPSHMITVTENIVTLGGLPRAWRDKGYLRPRWATKKKNFPQIPRWKKMGNLREHWGRLGESPAHPLKNPINDPYGLLKNPHICNCVVWSNITQATRVFFIAQVHCCSL